MEQSDELFVQLWILTFDSLAHLFILQINKYKPTQLVQQVLSLDKVYGLFSTS